jgi:hypothetical protein
MVTPNKTTRRISELSTNLQIHIAPFVALEGRIVEHVSGPLVDLNWYIQYKHYLRLFSGHPLTISILRVHTAVAKTAQPRTGTYYAAKGFTLVILVYYR